MNALQKEIRDYKAAESGFIARANAADAKYNDLLVKYQALKHQYDVNHPQILAIQQQIDLLNREKPSWAHSHVELNQLRSMRSLWQAMYAILTKHNIQHNPQSLEAALQMIRSLQAKNQ